MARHGVPVVGVMGNNGIWALEKHPMEFLYGYSVAAELRPETRYDQVVEALGGHGELVRAPERAAAGAGARVRVGQAGAGERADGSRASSTRAGRTWPRAESSAVDAGVVAGGRAGTATGGHEPRASACEAN